MTRVLILGLGPAGRALAHRCVARGIDVCAVDPHPDRRWTPTYASWSDELPAWLHDTAIATAVGRPEVFTTRRTVIPREYAVLDTPGLQDALSLEGVEIVSGTVVDARRDAVTLADGRTLRADRVVDARGVGRSPDLPEQTAYGIVVPGAAAAPALEGAAAWFMDWRGDYGSEASPGTPSFLYAMPLGDGTVLLEETCLVGRPALAPAELRRRLEYRLRARGVEFDDTVRVERVHFPISAPRPKRAEPVAFGSRGRLMHPGTGYSVAASLGAADVVVSALLDDVDLRRALWPARTRGTAALRRAGLRTLLGLAPEQVSPFFAAFFDLPIADQRAYLSGRSELGGSTRAMLRLFGRLSPDLRRVAVTRTILPGRRSPSRSNSTKMER